MWPPRLSSICWKPPPPCEDRAAASFWIGKTQMAQGDTQAADTTWQVTAGIDPTGYYSERALDLTRNRQPFTPPQTYDLGVDLASERQQADDWVRKTFSVPADTSLSGLGPLGRRWLHPARHRIVEPGDVQPGAPGVRTAAPAAAK